MVPRLLPRNDQRVERTVEIVPVQTKAEWHDFHHLPFKIYRDDPQWVAPLLLERQFHFQAKHNPYFQHAHAAFFLAYQGRRAGRPHHRPGRPAASGALSDGTGHFGFIEAVDDQDSFRRPAGCGARTGCAGRA